MTGLFWIALGGSAGALSRYAVYQLLSGFGSVAGTLTVNTLGSLAVGFLIQLPQVKNTDDVLRLSLVVGFAGAFTTFSAFSADTLDLWASGRVRDACLNIGLQLICGLAGIAVGAGLGGKLLS